METIYDFLSCVSNRKRLGGALKYFFVLLTLVFSLFAGFSSAQAATHTVRFVYDCEGTRHECAVMTRETGAPFAFLPQNPFCAGKNFNHWVNDANNAVVDESTTVNGDMVVRAVYDDISLYTITVNYYYIDCSNGDAKKVFDQAAYIIDGTKVTDGHPYQITSPAQTNVPVAVQNCTANATDDIFYPEEPTISITSVELAALGSEREMTREVKYVPFTATYSFVYKLKNLTGTGYTEIDRENNVHGVKNSTVTATVKNFDYAEFESTTPTLITEASGQEIDVLYTRKNFLLSFNTNGGTPVNAIQSPYGSEVTIPSSNPTRTGYDFAGWYTDEELTQRVVGGRVTLNADQTLYAKWTGKTVNYTIVYMFEKYNEEGTSSSFVYDNSEVGQATVGSTVSATNASIPDKTRKGWEKDNAQNASSSIEVKADGSAVLYVYYKLKEYTFRFNAGTYNRYDVYATLIGHNVTNQQNQLSYSMTVKLGQDISSTWPMEVTGYYSTGGWFSSSYDVNFYGWYPDNGENSVYVTKRLTVTEDMLPSSNNSNVVTYTAQWLNGGYTIAVEYWLQDENGVYQKDERLSQTYHSSKSGSQNNLNPKDISGYENITAPSGFPSTGEVCDTTVVESGSGDYVIDDEKSVSGAQYVRYNGHFYREYRDRSTQNIEGDQQRRYRRNSDGSYTRNNNGSYVRDDNRQYESYGVAYEEYEGHYFRSRSITFQNDYGKTRYNIITSNCVYTFRFYYNRETHTITYKDGSTTLKTVPNIMFGANINSTTYNYTPNKPSGKEDYTWGGWKSDANLTTDYTFDVMPGNNLSLYACWNAPKYTVTFNLNYEGASEPYYSQTVEKYKVATDPGLPSRAHYMFEGWYTDPVGGARYSVGEQVTSDVTLYAHWQLIPLEYTVKYLEEGTNNELFTEKTVKSPAFTLGYEVTEQALTIAGYMPDNAEKRLILDYEGNVITFFYVTKPENNKYKVRYLLKDSNISVHEESDWVEVPGNTTSITVLAANVDKTWMGGQPGVTQDILAKDYYPEEAATSFQLGKDGESNIFTIYYLDYKSVIFNITYVDMCGNPIPGIPVVKKAVQKNAMYELDRNLQGYTFNKLCASWAGLPEPQCSTYVSSTPVVWEAPDGPSSLEAWAYFQKNLTITAKNQNKTYDGTALRSEGTDDVTLLGLETGHALSSISYDGSVTNVSEGSVPTTPRDAQFTGACDSFYHIEYVPGNLRIDPQNVTVALNPDRWTNGDCYNGVPRTIGFRNNGAEIIISSALYDSQHGDEIRTQASAISMTKTDAGTYTLPEADVLNGVRIPEDQNYNVTPVVRDGELVICPAPLTVTTGSATKYYDGEPLTKSDGATFSGLVGDETATFVVTGTQTNVGESDNTYTINWGTAKESNYTITETLGTLKVNLLCTDTTLQTADDATDCTAEYTLVAPNTLDEGLSYFYKINDGVFAEFTGSVTSSFSDGDSIVWQARNNGSVFSTCAQAVRVEDETKPVIDNIPDQNAIAAGGCQYKIPNLKELVLAQATDNCQVDESYFVQLPDSNSMYEQGLDERTIPIEVKVRDMEGNEQTATVNVIIPANDLNVAIQSPTAGCPGQSYTFDSNVQGGMSPYTYEWNDDPAENAATYVLAAEKACTTYTIKLKVTDANGCALAAQPVEFTTVDTENPTITGALPALTVTGCSTDVLPDAYTTVAQLEANGLTVSDNCTVDEDLTVAYSDASAGTCPIVVTRTYKVTDKCGNYSEVEQRITINIDNTITITGGTNSKNIQCIADAVAPHTLTPSVMPTVKDACGNTLDQPEPTKSESINGCEGTVTYTYKYVNCAWGEQPWVFTYKIEKVTPTITTALRDDNLGCNPTVVAPTAADFAVSDVCDPSAVATVTSAGKTSADGCSYSQTWTASYTNTCDEEATPVKITFTWKQTTAPVIALADGKQASYDLGCNPATKPEPDASWFVVTDNCDAAGEATVSSEETNDGCTYTKVYTASYTNTCDEEATPVKITFTWKQDENNPVITPSVTTIAATNAGSCQYTVPDVIALVTISDECTALSELQISQLPAEGEYITETKDVTITVIDGCNNKSEQTITVTVPEDLNAEITSAESFCYNTSDGVIEGTIKGGSAPYTLNWTDGGSILGSQDDVMDIKIDSLPDGDYTVTVTDVNGCHIDLNATIAQLTQTITLTADSETKVYDGKELTLHGYTGADNLESGDVISDVVFSDDSKITNVGDVANTITSFRIMRGDKDVTCYYDTMMVPGLLKVTKRQVTLTSLDSTKFYDGTGLVRHEVVVSGDGFAAGEGATYDVTGSQKLVGTSANKFTYTLNAGTLAENYDIKTNSGTLEVKANVTNIAIASASESWMYDCDPHKREVYTVTYGTETVAADESGKTFTLPTGDKLTIIPTTEGVKYVSDTEERNNSFTYTLENDNQYAGDRDTTYGTLSITQRPIVITAKDSTKIYDAIALTRNEFFTDGNEADCDNVVSVVIEGSQLNVGQSVNKISGAVIKSGDEVVTDNYDITYVDGTLEVTPLDVIVTITGHTKTVIYNGTEQTVYGYDWKSTDDLYNTADYFTYAGDSVAKGMTVGTYPMGLEADQFNNTNNNFNVTFDVTDGWLTINRLDVIVDITGHVNTLTYNGVTQYVYGYDWKANTDLYTESDFRHVNDSVAAGTTIGTYPMGLEVGQFTNVNENFTVVFNLVSDGRLTINKIPTPITITAFSSTMVYDGGELTDDEFRYTRNVLVDGDVLFADVEGSIMDVGSVPNVVTGYRVLRDGEDVTENYTFNPSVDGTLTVTKRPVTFTSATDEKTYDGTPLTNSTVAVTPTATGKGFVQGEGAKFIVTGTITEIGTVDNTFTFEPYSNTDTANYDITVVFGKLTINKIVTPIVITANSNSKMYDGTPLTDDGFTFTTDVVAEGDALIADVEGTITDFGTVANKVTGYRVVRGADDVTKNYTFGESVDGTLSITKRHVTLTSASDSKVYDRRPLTNSEVTVGGDGFAENEGATYNVKGTIIDFGKVANAFDYALKTNTKAINYDIDTVYGTLSITKRPTAIVYNYGYDVKPDTVSGFADEPYAKMSDPVRTGYDFKGWDAQLPALLPLDTLTVTAQWSLVTYEIQLDTFETITYTVEDHKVIDLNDYIPYYEGHDFMGWRNNNGEIVTSISTDDAGSVQLTATWHIATYYITYISNGKTLKTVPIVFADPIPAIEDPVREGYLFKGWSPAIPATMPEGGVTVTAQWGLITYQLTLEDEGKVVGVYEYTVEDEFFYIDKIEDREGMRFDGWMLNGAMLDYDRNEGKYVFFPSLFADNVSITAKWTMISDEFNLVYKVDGVTYLTYVISAGESTASYVASVQDPADKRGYKFNGWDMDVPETMPRKSLTVNAVWKPITYAITLRDTSGEEIERIYYTIEETVQLPTYPDRDGQIFLGWSDGVNTYYEIKPGSSAEDFELTASWGVKSFEIIYIVDGIEYARDTIQAGAPLVKISDPETAEEGYAFSGWSTTPDIMPAHDLTVTGSFEKGGYTLTYVIDGETIKSVRYLYGAAISPTKAPNRPGYAFDVWEGLPATMPARDLTVNGKYKVATYSIVLRNEGVALDTIYYTIFDDAIALPVIEGPGKMFKGWYDGRKTVNRIKPSDYSGNIDLVASWIYFNYTVTFYVDDVQYSKNNSMRYGDVIQLPEEPTKEGLYFAGWKNMPADGLMPENDLKLYAIFSTEPVINVGTDDFEEVPTVDVYTEVGEIVVLRAENMDIQVLDFDGVTLFIGKSNAEKFSIPVRYRGAYIVRINNQFRKVLVK